MRRVFLNDTLYTAAVSVMVNEKTICPLGELTARLFFCGKAMFDTINRVDSSSDLISDNFRDKYNGSKW